MTDEQDCSASSGRYFLHFSDGFLLEFGIANGEDFINDEDLGFEESCDSEAKADGHTRGETLDRGVEVSFYAREIDYLIEFAVNLVLAHAHNGAVHVDIVPGGHFGVEAGADLKQGGYAASIAYMAGAGGCDMAEELEEGTLAGAVLADDADDVALLNLE